MAIESLSKRSSGIEITTRARLCGKRVAVSVECNIRHHIARSAVVKEYSTSTICLPVSWLRRRVSVDSVIRQWLSRSKSVDDAALEDGLDGHDQAQRGQRLCGRWSRTAGAAVSSKR